MAVKNTLLILHQDVQVRFGWHSQMILITFGNIGESWLTVIIPPVNVSHLMIKNMASYICLMSPDHYCNITL